MHARTVDRADEEQRETNRAMAIVERECAEDLAVEIAKLKECGADLRRRRSCDRPGKLARAGFNGCEAHLLARCWTIAAAGIAGEQCLARGNDVRWRDASL